ncbi:hypothetical protein [Dyadobacter frigoris]|uniref:Uncharacterized protein n=1 Tax=Dyadobacter frigoris TaxID=2576211 RepID=A0A4U6D4Z4_9BACT|nr:hypothetical protein [Dyadobacter frigoris]TKT92352.1 hypothetical protein FDK13_10275 [Dyadobacter frigoris]GLU53540.1 hypothetical protein Dfri01_30010 [Dyadobacter frigoris]
MELIREIIVPTDNTYLLKLPDEMIGKQVEIIAFEIEARPDVDIEERERRRMEIREIFKDSLVDLSNFKFDRDEANNYDE